MSLQITKQDLIEAAARLAALGQERHAATCADMATKVERLTDKAKLYANDLIAKSMDANNKKLPPQNPYPRLAQLFFRDRPLASLDFGRVQLRLKNDGSVCFVKLDDKVVVGVIEREAVRLFPSKCSPIDLELVKRILEQLNADPIKAAVEHGRATGRCCVCSRTLTNPTSIDAGIGPICSGRLA